MPSTPLRQLNSMSEWLSDGATTVWNFSFSDGYISRNFVKAFYVDTLGNKTTIPITAPMFTGPFQLQITPQIPLGYVLRIYRDTPKTAPLVDFVSGADLSELNLDTIARQAVHIAAEVLDGAGFLVTDEFGFKSLRRNSYTGASTVQITDNGKMHFKPTGGGVTIPSTLPDEFLCTIVNYDLSPINLLFTGGVPAILQGGPSTAGSMTWQLAPKQAATINRIAATTDSWLISGKVT